MKRVFSSYNQVLIHHCRNLLEAAGIETQARNLLLSSAMGELPPAECQAELWVVNDADAQRAHEILQQREIPGPAWTCPGCGEVSGPQFTQCWRCGALRRSAPG